MDTEEPLPLSPDPRLEFEMIRKPLFSFGARGKLGVLCAASLLAPSVAMADEISQALFTANNVWMMLAAALVFIMHLGFAMVESGLTRAKNTTNILFKNTFIICVGILTYFIVGFNLMYPGDFSLGSFFGFAGFGLSAGFDEASQHGGLRGRWLHLLDGLPVPGDVRGYLRHDRLGRRCGADQARIVHDLLDDLRGVRLPDRGLLEVGRRLARRRGLLRLRRLDARPLGRRLGRADRRAGARAAPWQVHEGRQAVADPGQLMPLPTIGVFLLWLGWFGFNGGSVLSADPELTSFTLVTTCLAAAAGGIGAMIAYTFISTKPDLSMALNGILAGLVGITAGADVINPTSAILVGFIAGMLVVGSVLIFDKLKIDDPVGAISVHLTCGIWGTLAVGIFSTNPEHSLGIQAYRRPLLWRLHGGLRFDHLPHAEGRDRAPRLRGRGARGTRPRRARHACLRPVRIPGLHGRGLRCFRRRHGFPQVGDQRELNT